MTPHIPENSDEGDQAQFIWGYWSAVANDIAPITNWDHYIGLPYLKPRQVACLLHRLGPTQFRAVASSVNRDAVPVDQKSMLINRINEIAETARRHLKGGLLPKDANAEEWAAWAESKGYVLPREWQARRDPTKNRNLRVASTQSSPQEHDTQPNATTWTDVRRDELRKEHAQLRASGSRSPTKDLASKYDVSETRIRELKREPASKPNPWKDLGGK